MLDLDRMAERAEPQAKKDFLGVWRILDSYVSLDLFQRAVQERRSNLIQDSLPWQGLTNALYAEYRRILLKLFEQGGEAQFNAIVGKADRPAGFHVEHPEAERWARTYAGRLVQGLTRETQRALAEAIAESIRLQIPPEQAARMLRQMLGLTTPSVRAVLRFQDALRRRGFSDAYITQKANEYSRRLLNHRARVVARTETLRAMQEGQRQSFQQAVEQGVLQPNRTRRMWVTAADERVCTRICLPMDQQLTTLDEPWQTSVGPVQIPSEVHPSCRCASVLVFAGPDGKFPDKPPRTHDTGQPVTPRTLRPKVRREP